MDLQSNIYRLVILMPGLLLAISIHETAHAYIAHKFGDNTALNQGRVSLNPFVHMDPIGTLLMPILIIVFNMPLLGWGKPVPVNVFKFKKYKEGIFWVSAAGPLSNLAIAILLAALYRVFIYAVPHLYGSVPDNFISVLNYAFQSYLFLNIILFLFNLIPVFPLDGSKILYAILPRGLDDRFEALFTRLGPVVLILLVLTGALGKVLWPPVKAMYNLLMVGV